MTTLNRQRANIVFSTLFDEDRILTPSETSQQERIFERDGVLRWKASSTTCLGSCRIGVSFRDLVSLVALSATAHTTMANGKEGKENDETRTLLTALLQLFEAEEYILWLDPSSKRAVIVLKTHATPTAQLKAWSHALLVAKRLNTKRGASKTRDRESSMSMMMMGLLRETLPEHSRSFDARVSRLRDAGWDADTPSLQTKPGRRVDFRKQE